MVVIKVHKTPNVYENYLTLDAGAKQGIKPDVGVINSLGIIGNPQMTLQRIMLQ